MSPLKDVFDDDGRADKRINRMLVRNRKLASKANKKTPKIGIAPIASLEARVDDEVPDSVLNTYKDVNFMQLFLSRLPKRVKPLGFDEKVSIAIFGNLVKSLKKAGASKRGIYRALTVLAKNISVYLADFKLPLEELNLRRFTAYRDSLAERLKPYLLPKGSLEWLLASDSAKNNEFELDVKVTAYTTEVEFTSVETGDSRTLRIQTDRLHDYIQNREILQAIKDSQDENTA